MQIPAIKNSQFVNAIDIEFLEFLSNHHPKAHNLISAYRNNHPFNENEISNLIIYIAPILENFIASKFNIIQDIIALKQQKLSHDPVLKFKTNIVQKARKAQNKTTMDFDNLNIWLKKQISQDNDLELAIATYAISVPKDDPSMDKIMQWCQHASNMQEYQNWISFKFPEKINSAKLVNTKEILRRDFTQRQGFDLADLGMSERELQAQADYCIYCHKNQGDFCKRGFPVKKSEPNLGLKTNAFDDHLTGCPLEEKISEMQYLARHGYSIAPLAIIMIDNPMCPATGHRVCNDCMKACIYQKQTPVDIPQIETGVLNTVLNLKWGVEIYDLLLNWNPLRQENFKVAEPNDSKTLIMGMGPAGFTLANQLLMRGFSVVGVDGLKIEPTTNLKTNQLIENFNKINQALSSRDILGFGGVAEYGITARWNKNYLSLILLTLLRREQFRVFGGVRFGGTITVEDAWSLGFDHLSLAVGAGLPRELKIPGSLAPGVRAANDFLMALQLSGAHKENSLTSLEVELPAIIIGGGLTGIDAATELQAYYLLQITKISLRYNKLCHTLGTKKIRQQFNSLQLKKLDKWIEHAKLLQAENQKTHPDIVKLVHSWGGVSVMYRKRLIDSPAYKRNHEELIKALESGILYIECFEPKEINVDDNNQTSAVLANKIIIDNEGHWQKTNQTASFMAKSVLVATGASPNVAYAFEHSKTFARKKFEYIPYTWQNNKLIASPPAMHCKDSTIGMFTSYIDDKNHCVSFIGDTHPTYHGSVVKAIASGMKAAPLIANIVKPKNLDKQFLSKCSDYFSSMLLNKEQINPNTALLTIYAPAIVAKYQPGQFIRLQTYSTLSQSTPEASMHSDALALPVVNVNKDKKTLSTIIQLNSINAKLIYKTPINTPISVMGPTGVKTKILTNPACVLILVEPKMIANALSIISALKDSNHFVIVMFDTSTDDEIYWQDKFEQLADIVFWQDYNKKCADLFNWLKSNPKHANNLIDIRIMLEATKIDTARNLISQITKITKTQLSICTASVYGPMQCMLKGVCAQCLQWQIDPITQQRTKAVYACSWQDQPVEIIDINHLQQRQNTQSVLEMINLHWLKLMEATQ